LTKQHPAEIQLGSVNANELVLAIIGGAFGDFTAYAASAGQTAFKGAWDGLGSSYSISASYKSVSAGQTTSMVRYTTPAVEYNFAAVALKPSAGVTNDAIFFAGN
jgi:hypothetical protein